jgi:hypothetical protein
MGRKLHVLFLALSLYRNEIHSFALVKLNYALIFTRNCPVRSASFSQNEAWNTY